MIFATARTCRNRHTLVLHPRKESARRERDTSRYRHSSVQQTPSRSRSGRLRVLRVLRRPQILRIPRRLNVLRVLWRLDDLGILRRLHLLRRLHVLCVLRCPRIMLRRSRGLRVLRRFVGRGRGWLLPALMYVSPLRSEELGECDAALCGSEAFLEADDLFGLSLEVKGVALDIWISCLFWCMHIEERNAPPEGRI